MSEEYYTPEEIAERFKITRNAVYNWVKRRKLRAIKIGGATRIPKEALENFIRDSQEEEEEKQ